jgi:hypothetical protein
MNPVARIFFVVVAVVTFTVGAVSYGGYRIIIQSKEQSQFNGSLLRILLGVSGCTVNDTPQACAQRQADRSLREGRQRVADVDCRIRRALARQPSPPADAACSPG